MAPILSQFFFFFFLLQTYHFSVLHGNIGNDSTKCNHGQWLYRLQVVGLEFKIKNNKRVGLAFQNKDGQEQMTVRHPVSER